jgi:exonuclease V
MHSSPASAAPCQEVPVEVVSDEKMALIDAALAAASAAAGARPLLSSAARRAAAPLSRAAYSAGGGDIEDSPLPRRSLLARFRERRALAVTDITATVTSSPKARAFRISLSPLSWVRLRQTRCARIQCF